jgi:pilus assembly protein Flp/PilA
MDLQVQFAVRAKTKDESQFRWTEHTMTRVTVTDSLIRLWNEESGQGLVEYVLILALVAFAAVAGMSSLASSINSAFSKVGTYLGKYIS